MIKLHSDKDLQPLNTMAIPSTARYFYKLTQPDELNELSELSRAKSVPIRTLGDGSNLILPGTVDALVVHNRILEKTVINETELSVDISVGAGENWHDFVAWTIHCGYSGLENLALIPGTVGASPVQNIGAYGLEAGDKIISVKAYDLKNKEFRTFSQADCEFDYRNSLFKQYENRYIITCVTFRLNKNFTPALGYGSLADLVDRPGLSAKMVFDHIVQIRQEKLPDPDYIPNVGSFFKNPVVSSETFHHLLKSFPDLVSYKTKDGHKLAAAWLIDKAGLKGESGQGGVGNFKHQALVIINPEKETSEKVLAWATHVANQVKQLFGVELEIEPRQW